MATTTVINMVSVPSDDGTFAKCDLGLSGLKIRLNNAKVIKPPHEYYGRHQVTLQVGKQDSDKITKIVEETWFEIQQRYPDSNLKQPLWKNTLNVRVSSDTASAWPKISNDFRGEITMHLYCRRSEGKLNFGFYFTYE